VTRMRGMPPSRLLRKALGTPLVVAGSLPADHMTSASLVLMTGPRAYSTDEYSPSTTIVTFSTVSSRSKTWMASLGEPTSR
jgi:hypothetical protein